VSISSSQPSQQHLHRSLPPKTTTQWNRAGLRPRLRPKPQRNAPSPFRLPTLGTATSLPFVESRHIQGQDVLIRYSRHHSARRYRLTLLRDGSARCTVPDHGSLVGGQKFVSSCEGWLIARLEEARKHSRIQKAWQVGSQIWLEGQKRLLEKCPTTSVLRLGSLEFPAPETLFKSRKRPDEFELRPYLETLLWRASVPTLQSRTVELAGLQGIRIQQVSVRNQKSRWGSCSRNGSISLNWRLIQLPPEVKDYIILHELAHRRHLNHSQDFWEEVGRICPDYESAEFWLKQHGREIL